MLTPRNKLFAVLVATVSGLTYMLGLFLTVILGVALVFAIASLLIYYQEHILYIPVIMGYKTIDDNPEGYRSPAEWGVEYKDFYIGTVDTQTIHGWHITRPNPVATVIFCHENAGNIGLRVNNLVAMSKRLNVEVVAFDYRGYGHSTGRPSESGLMIDTDSVYLYVTDVLKPRNIYLYGRSLGGAVALQFASVLGTRGDTRLRAVIAENTFTSISDMVGSVFPLLNVAIVKKYFLRLKWETDKVIDSIKAPVMLISGLKDEIVPASHMAELKRICDRHNVSTEMVTYPEGMHNDTWVVGGDDYWNKIATFIKRNNK